MDRLTHYQKVGNFTSNQVGELKIVEDILVIQLEITQNVVNSMVVGEPLFIIGFIVDCIALWRDDCNCANIMEFLIITYNFRELRVIYR